MERTFKDFLISKAQKDCLIASANLKSYFKKYFKALAFFMDEKDRFKVIIIIDDTDVPDESDRNELKEKLLQRIYEIFFKGSLANVSLCKFSVILLLVTELWDMLREKDIEIFTYLRKGTPLYDTGFFLPLKILVNEGKIKPTREYTDKLIFIGGEMFGIARSIITTRLMEDLYRGIVAATQALLGTLGYRFPSPKECIEFAREILYEKERVIDESDVKIIEDVIKTFKKLEHGEIKEVNAETFKDLLDRSEKYLKKVVRKIKEIRKEKEEGLYDFFKKVKRKI